jgi:hypothetical protein
MKAPIPVCMVGAGRVARVHTQSIMQRLPHGEVIAVVDPDQSARQNLMTAVCHPPRLRQP